MKRLINKTRNLINMPSAMLISALVHGGLIALAGILIAFTVLPKEPPEFIPPPEIDRPKMDLKKPQVKVKKNIKPKSSQRIVAKNVPVMDSVALPPMGSGVGDLTGGLQGFDMMPDPSEMNLFGGAKSLAVGNDLEGTFYSLVYDRRGRPTSMDRDVAFETVAGFVESGWNPNYLARFFRAPQKMYTTHLTIPSLGDDSGPPDRGRGPEFFGISDANFNPIHWVVHYKGKIASRKTKKFRFWGTSNGIFVVRVNGEIVFDGTWTSLSRIDWETSAEENNQFMMLTHSAKVGEWFELEAETPVEFEAVLFKNETRKLGYLLTVEEEGEDYEENPLSGLPILPSFKTAEFSPSQVAEIEYLLLKNEADLHSELMFNVY
jgi:hypothetical protein